MRVRLLFAVMSACVAFCLVAPVAQAQDISARIKQAADGASLEPVQYSVHVKDLETGRELVAFDAGRPMIPASNQKLFSSGAALLTLGCDFEFVTSVRTLGDRVVLEGAGDPALADPALLERLDPIVTVEQVLGGLADAVVSSGLNEIREIVLDDRVFDRNRVHPSWPTDQLNRWYCAEVDGLSFHANVLRVFPAPGEAPGVAPIVELQPRAPWMDVRVRARTVSSGRSTVWVARTLGGNTFTVMGDVPRRLDIDVAVHEPSRWFGELLANRLRAAGATVGGIGAEGYAANRFAAVRYANDAEMLAGGRTVAEIRTPITEIATRCNKASYNLYADCLLKRMGHEISGEPGSWENGAAVIRMLLSERLGARVAAETDIADGSGMSRLNRVSAETVTAWLDTMAESDAANCFIQSLPTIGEGSLRSRFKETKPVHEVRAKSGTLNGVRCLSGYVTHRETGRQVAFSVLVNNLANGSQARAARLFHERVALACDEWLQAQETQMGG